MLDKLLTINYLEKNSINKKASNNQTTIIKACRVKDNSYSNINKSKNLFTILIKENDKNAEDKENNKIINKQIIN